MSEPLLTVADSLKDRARAALGSRNLILVGLMGAGKSAVGRIVASQLAIPFVDSDLEIERVSRMTRQWLGAGDEVGPGVRRP